MKFLKAPCFMVIMYEHSTNYEKKIDLPSVTFEWICRTPTAMIYRPISCFSYVLCNDIIRSLEQNVWLLNKSAILLRSNEIIRS